MKTNYIFFYILQSPMIQVVAYHAQQATLNIDKGADKLDKARRTKIRNLKVNFIDFNYKQWIVRDIWYVDSTIFFHLLLSEKNKTAILGDCNITRSYFAITIC